MITLINVFTVDPDHQQRLIEILTAATEMSVSQADGFVAATLHRSTDGTKVTMYAQWRSMADYQAMREDPSPRRYFEEALSIATFDLGIYEVVRTFTPHRVQP
ncbi:quinol monooxygenase YgiN [Ancylobacter sp. 3268]|uniref:antibiotic biosynthesis monooxygenase family protein n=1 Tax=Ancylobacter sp. 3268 TaxID=2817752 RepID=UPI002867379F|nr:antibiotic biosynthesis monooxygenase family protein [Ancylobacter sp. 3268]MDR6953931.1 quinol monooxygenase YgiN [Ancylobacter sp. 3268]